MSLEKTVEENCVYDGKVVRVFCNKSELENGNYHKEPEKSGGYFGDGRTMYKLDKADEFDAEMQKVYGNFSLWLASWEV